MQELGGEKRDDHPQNHSRSRTDHDPFQALLSGQRPDSHGDHNGVVSGEDEVDQDDAQEGGDKFPTEGDVSQQIQIHVGG